MKKQDSFKIFISFMAIVALSVVATSVKAASSVTDLIGTYAFTASGVESNPGNLPTSFDMTITTTATENELSFSGFVSSGNVFVGTFDSESQKITVNLGQDVSGMFDVLCGADMAESGTLEFTVNSDGTVSIPSPIGISSFMSSSVLYSGGTLTKKVVEEVDLADVVGTYTLTATESSYLDLDMWGLPTENPSTIAKTTGFDFTISLDAASGENAITIAGMWGLSDITFKAVYNKGERSIVIAPQTVGNWDITREISMIVESADEIVINDASFTLTDVANNEGINISKATAAKISGSVKESSQDETVKIYTAKGCIYTQATENGVVEVYGINGVRLKVAPVNTEIDMPQGVYLVKVGDKVEKIIL